MVHVSSILDNEEISCTKLEATNGSYIKRNAKYHFWIKILAKLSKNAMQ